MNVVVCVKQIPDPAAPQALDPETRTLVRQGKLILDDSDAYGVEMGLQLADQAGGDVVTLVSMAPHAETSGLRTALAMGADRASAWATSVISCPAPAAPTSEGSMPRSATVRVSTGFDLAAMIPLKEG